MIVISISSEESELPFFAFSRGRVVSFDFLTPGAASLYPGLLCDTLSGFNFSN